MTKSVRCISCGKSSITTSQVLGLCASCIRDDFSRWRDRIAGVHSRLRLEDGLPGDLPQTSGGILCTTCGNQCMLGADQIGYCGLRRVGRDGRLRSVIDGGSGARVSWYRDPLPTNCVADWVCAGGSSAGYPRWSCAAGPEYGFFNLAVFYEACSFDCLFCQNWHFRTSRSRPRPASDVADDASDRVTCICFFGGDPGPQITHALGVSRLVRRRRKDVIIRICWETNGNISSKYLPSMIRESMETGGTIKIDIKAWSESICYALCGRSNRRSLEVTETLLRISAKRPEVPLFVASTLLVPGYVDESEVRAIAEFIASINPETPYSLLGFAPAFRMSDLPVTSVDHAERCAQAALDAGLERVRIGNRHLLGRDY